MCNCLMHLQWNTLKNCGKIMYNFLKIGSYMLCTKCVQSGCVTLCQGAEFVTSTDTLNNLI